MRFTTRSISARRLLALVAVATIGACSDDGTGLTLPDPTSFSSNGGTGSGTQNPGPKTPSDTTAGSPSGEWHLATIRGILRGVTGSLASGDTSSSSISAVVGATIEIHKFSLSAASASAGDTAAMRAQDLGVVATVITDAAGKFQYVLSEPLVVKSGQPSPMTTYRLSVTPPRGSPFAAQSGIQVFFMEQFPAGTADFAYYLFPPKS